MSVLLALLSSLLWGTADFLGGTATRRLPALTVVAVSQAIALVALLPIALAFGAAPDTYWQGAAAGIVGVLALGAFYAALASGTMGVVAPIAALGALVPVTVGLVRGEEPASLQLVGIAVAIGGVVLASGPELSGGASARPLLLACGAAVGFGTVAVLLADGSDGSSSGSVLGTLVVMRLASALLLSLTLLAAPALRSGVMASDLRLLALIGLGDVGANATFAFASRGELLSVVAVLASLYPVVTVLLARQIHAERLLPIQVAGVVTTLVGVGLLAAA